MTIRVLVLLVTLGSLLASAGLAGQSPYVPLSDRLLEQVTGQDQNYQATTGDCAETSLSSGQVTSPNCPSSAQGTPECVRCMNGQFPSANGDTGPNNVQRKGANMNCAATAIQKWVGECWWGSCDNQIQVGLCGGTPPIYEDQPTAGGGGDPGEGGP